MRPLKKREQKYKENARAGLPTGTRTLDIIRSRQEISKKGGRPIKLFPDYKGPINPSDGDPGESS